MRMLQILIGLVLLAWLDMPLAIAAEDPMNTDQIESVAPISRARVPMGSPVRTDAGTGARGSRCVEATHKQSCQSNPLAQSLGCMRETRGLDGATDGLLGGAENEH